MISRKDPTTRTGPAQWLLGATFACLAIGAGGVSLAMNAAFGYKAGLAMAAIFIMSDLAKICLPAIAAMLGGWNIHRRTAYAFALIISIVSAASYLLETQATRLIQSQAAEDARSGAQSDLDRARAELADITEVISTDALEQLSKAAQDSADREAARGGCGRKCESLKSEAAQILERLGKAKRRDALQAQIAAAKQTVSQTPNEALGAADTIAYLTGADKAEIANHNSIVSMILMLMISELLAMFSGDATAILKRCMVGARRKAPATPKQPLQADEISGGKGARNYWMQRLSKERPDLAATVIAGEISCYKACIKAGIRKAPATKWTHPEDYGINLTSSPSFRAGISPQGR